MAPVAGSGSFMSIGEWDVSIPPSSLVLKLGVGYESVRYYLETIAHGQIVRFGMHRLHHVETAEELAARLRRVAEKDEALQHRFGKVVVMIDGDYSLVPLEYGGRVEEMESVAVLALKLHVVFAVPEEIRRAVDMLFGNVVYMHPAATLLRVLGGYEKHRPGDSLYVVVEQEYFDVVCFLPSGELRLMNRYRYEHENDFIYFLLLCCEELQMDRSRVRLVLVGEVDIQSRIYSLCFRYFSEPEFITQPEEVVFTKAFELYPKHYHFSLYNLGA